MTPAAEPTPAPSGDPATVPDDVSVVIPVYRGARTLPGLLEELAVLRERAVTPAGHPFRVSEVVLVWDNGPDESDVVIERLAQEYDWVRPIWLSRNFGQHPATVAGMSSTRGEWVVTMDEDGQHQPQDIGALLDVARRDGAALVYAEPTNAPPHSRLRNLASRLTKGVVLRALLGGPAVPFHSFRLIHGEHARAVAAFCGPGVYLDIALGWVIGSVSQCPAHMRTEGRASANYSTRRLLSHFWRLVLSSGNRPLRAVSILGVASTVIGVIYALVQIGLRLFGTVAVEGWTSMIVAILLLGGLTLMSLGVIAEYLGMAASMSAGRSSWPSRRRSGRPSGPTARTPDAMDVWVIGAGGLLGSAVVRSVGASDRVFPAPAVPWRSPDDSVATLRRSLAAFHAWRDPLRPWSTLWTAGSGVIASSAAQLSAEAAVAGAFAEDVARRPEPDGALLFASTASILGDSGAQVLDESAPPDPRNTYAHAKLRQEEAVTVALEGARPPGHRPHLDALRSRSEPRQAAGVGQLDVRRDPSARRHLRLRAVGHDPRLPLHRRCRGAVPLPRPDRRHG